MTGIRGMTLGQAVLAIRQNAGDTQQQMADALGVSNVWLSNVEGDKREPSLALCRQIHLLYGYCPLLLSALSRRDGETTKHLLFIGSDWEELFKGASR